VSTACFFSKLLAISTARSNSQVIHPATMNKNRKYQNIPGLRGMVA
jgi:hypothetical protein